MERLSNKNILKELANWLAPKLNMTNEFFNE